MTDKDSQIAALKSSNSQLLSDLNRVRCERDSLLDTINSLEQDFEFYKELSDELTDEVSARRKGAYLKV